MTHQLPQEEAPLPPFAPLRRRCAAGLVDLVPSAVLIVPLSLVAGGWGFVLGMLLACAYFAVLEAHDGRSLGKRALGLRVLQLDGSPCTRLGAVLRNVFRIIDAFPGFYAVALVSLAGSPRKQRIGDQAAGTSVFLDPAARAGRSRA
jgi:uncharacterized RDD family membrane protein YckC